MSSYHPFSPIDERFLDLIKLISSSLSFVGSLSLIIFSLIVPKVKRYRKYHTLRTEQNEFEDPLLDERKTKTSELFPMAAVGYLSVANIGLSLTNIF